MPAKAVMAALAPAIHVFDLGKIRVRGTSAGHDELIEMNPRRSAGAYRPPE